LPTLATETNTFHLPTSLASYRDRVSAPGDTPDAPRVQHHFRGAPACRYVSRWSGLLCSESSGWQSPGLRVHARRDLAQIELSSALDGVLLGLPRAMVAYGYDDVEGDIIEHARGCQTRVSSASSSITLPSALKRVRIADIIITYKEFLTDVVDRAESARPCAEPSARDQASHVAMIAARSLVITTLPLMRGSSTGQGNGGTTACCRSQCHAFRMGTCRSSRPRSCDHLMATKLGQRACPSWAPSLSACGQDAARYLDVGSAVRTAMTMNRTIVLRTPTTPVVSAVGTTIRKADQTAGDQRCDQSI
jgi:hypothetical protein